VRRRGIAAGDEALAKPLGEPLPKRAVVGVGFALEKKRRECEWARKTFQPVGLRVVVARAPAISRLARPGCMSAASGSRSFFAASCQ